VRFAVFSPAQLGAVAEQGVVPRAWLNSIAVSSHAFVDNVMRKPRTHDGCSVLPHVSSVCHAVPLGATAPNLLVEGNTMSWRRVDGEPGVTNRTQCVGVSLCAKSVANYGTRMFLLELEPFERPGAQCCVCDAELDRTTLLTFCPRCNRAGFCNGHDVDEAHAEHRARSECRNPASTLCRAQVAARKNLISLVIGAFDARRRADRGAGGDSDEIEQVGACTVATSGANEPVLDAVVLPNARTELAIDDYVGGRFPALATRFVGVALDRNRLTFWSDKLLRGGAENVELPFVELAEDASDARLSHVFVALRHKAKSTSPLSVRIVDECHWSAARHTGDDLASHFEQWSSSIEASSSNESSAASSSSSSPPPSEAPDPLMASRLCTLVRRFELPLEVVGALRADAKTTNNKGGEPSKLMLLLSSSSSSPSSESSSNRRGLRRHRRGRRRKRKN
jgi:hypothetical protein